MPQPADHLLIPLTPGRLIQDSLGGNCRTRIIATLSPTADCVDESISTLKFADRAKQVRAAGGDEQAIPSLASLYDALLGWSMQPRVCMRRMLSPP
jgi:hypothetical protein